MTLHYLFHLTCLDCGGELTHRAHGASSGITARTVVDCTVCGWEYVITAHMQAITKRVPNVRPVTVAPTIDHGTNRGYFQHLRHKAPFRDDCGCVEAHNDYQAAYRHAKRTEMTV